MSDEETEDHSVKLLASGHTFVQNLWHLLPAQTPATPTCSSDLQGGSVVKSPPSSKSTGVQINLSSTALNHKLTDVKGARCRVMQGDLQRWWMATRNLIQWTLSW